jgi:hypothetical protein
MSRLSVFLKQLFTKSFGTYKYGEAFLNEAVDIYDLERRMRQL